MSILRFGPENPTPTDMQAWLEGHGRPHDLPKEPVDNYAAIVDQEVFETSSAMERVESIENLAAVVGVPTEIGLTREWLANSHRIRASRLARDLRLRAAHTKGLISPVVHSEVGWILDTGVEAHSPVILEHRYPLPYKTLYTFRNYELSKNPQDLEYLEQIFVKPTTGLCHEAGRFLRASNAKLVDQTSYPVLPGQTIIFSHGLDPEARTMRTLSIEIPRGDGVVAAHTMMQAQDTFSVRNTPPVSPHKAL